MRKIIFIQEPETISFQQVNTETPIFAKKGNKFRGMIVNENRGWILRTGGKSGATGCHPTLEECMESCIPHGYNFYIED